MFTLPDFFPFSSDVCPYAPTRPSQVEMLKQMALSGRPAGKPMRSPRMTRVTRERPANGSGSASVGGGGGAHVPKRRTSFEPPTRHSSLRAERADSGRQSTAPAMPELQSLAGRIAREFVPSEGRDSSRQSGLAGQRKAWGAWCGNVGNGSLQ